MISFLRRLFGGSKPAPAPAPARVAPASRPAVARASQTISATSERASSSLEGSNGEQEPGAALARHLRTELHSALHRVDEGLIEQHNRSADTAALLRALRDDPLTGIRQLPVAAQRALALLHGEAPTGLLVDLFENDPAITQALLHQVNSTYYNPSGARVPSLSDAIHRMGRAGVQGVVLQQSVAGMVSRPGGELDGMAQKVWNHMVRVAPLARQFAPAFDVAPEQAFLLGLLHDVGKLVVFDRISELRAAYRRNLSVDRQVVARALRLLHEPLGGLLIQHWGLDIEIAGAVGSHHREPMPQRRDPLCETIYLVERLDLANERKEPFDLEAVWTAGQLSGDRQAVAELLELSSTEAAA